MKFLLFHPVHLPPKDYGGVERVVLWLATALRDLGHEVFVAALEGSEMPKGVRLIEMRKGAVSAADLVERLPAGIDVVHFHAPPELEFFERSSVPSLTTIHGNGKPGEVFPENSVFLSRDHAARHGRGTFVHNGADPAEFRFEPENRKNSLLFLSKTTWKVKNLAGAMAIAEAAKEPLTIAGGSGPWSLRLRACWRGQAWAGSVAGEKKARLLSEASALLFPVRWPEPFGLVMIEAMLSGTPVVGSALGSVSEVLGSSGIVVDAPFWEARSREECEDGLAKWTDGIRRVRKLDRTAVREDAVRRFSHRRMAEDYVEVYKRVIRGESLL